MAALVRADERLKNEFPLITLPVLILHGALDKNTKPSGSQHFYDRVGSVDKSLKIYEGSLHDLLNDLETREWLCRISKTGSMLGFPPHRKPRSRLMARVSEQRFEDELSELSGGIIKVPVSWLGSPCPVLAAHARRTIRVMVSAIAHRYLRAAPSRF
jgi:hypothetical protein